MCYVRKRIKHHQKYNTENLRHPWDTLGCLRLPSLALLVVLKTIYPDSFRGEDFFRFEQSDTKISAAAMFVDQAGLYRGHPIDAAHHMS